MRTTSSSWRGTRGIGWAWIEQTLEKRMGLKINREKTRVVNCRQGEPGLLGYTFRSTGTRAGGIGT